MGKLQKKGEIELWLNPRLWLADLNYNFENDWLIWTRTLNMIGLLNCPIIDNNNTSNNDSGGNNNNDINKDDLHK